MDKSILKVSGVVAIVLGIICSLTIVGLIVGVPMIIGGMKINDLSKLTEEEIYNNRETILIWSIVFLFICQISGILGIIYYLSISNLSFNFNGNKNNSDKYDELEKLNKLYKDKVLTKEEYEMEKSRILNKQ